jgi:acyl-coenzyme A thioesterase PaaI-like protein
MDPPILQDTYAPHGMCFGCGPLNTKGLRIKSRPEGEEVVADWTPEPHHASFKGFLAGGIISTLLDCHGNWTAVFALMKAGRLETAPGTVTAELSIRFLRPTPMGPVHIRARAVKIEGSKVSVTGAIESGGQQTAVMTGTFVWVKEGHPAFHRWE